MRQIENEPFPKSYSKHTGFDRAYLSGVESVLHLKHRGYFEYWDIMREAPRTK